MTISDTGTWITNLLRKGVVNVWKLKLSGNRMIDVAIDSLICMLVIGLIVALIIVGIKKINTNIVPLFVEIMDKWMLGITLLILGCNLFLGEYVKSIFPINLVVAIVCEITISVIVRIVIKRQE